MGNKQLLDNDTPTLVVPVIEDDEKKKKKKSTWLSSIKKAKEKRKERKLEKQKENVLPRTLDLLPFLHFEEDYIVLKNGFMDIVQLSSKDIDSLNDGELQLLILQEARFLRSYKDDVKRIGLNFRTNTRKQQEYWSKKLEKATNPIDIKHIERKIFELKFIEEKRTNREFFMFIYADKKEDLIEKRQTVKQFYRQSFPIKELSEEKKIDVLALLNNQNTKQ